MLSTLKTLCQEYVAFPIIEACYQRGLFQVLGNGKICHFHYIAQQLKIDDVRLNAMLEVLVSLGWLEKDGFNYRLLKKMENFVYIVSMELYQVSPENLLHNRKNQSLVIDQLEKLKTSSDVSLANNSYLFEGALLVPIIIALKNSDYETEKNIFSKLPDKLRKLIVQLFELKEWCVVKKGLKLTIAGKNVVSNANQLKLATVFRKELLKFNASLATENILDQNKNCNPYLPCSIELDEFLITAASVGLISENLASIYPEKKVSINKGMFDNLEEREYCVRLAKASDYPALYELEKLCVPKKYRVTQANIRRRLKVHPKGQFVLEVGKKVVGAIYSLRINDIKSLDGVTAETAHSVHVDDGSVVLLLSMYVRPHPPNIKLKEELLNFVLQRYSMLLDIGKLVNVTYCDGYSYSNNQQFEHYIKERDKDSKLVDVELRFHESHGAKISDVITGYYPKDKHNKGKAIKVIYSFGNTKNSKMPMLNAKVNGAECDRNTKESVGKSSDIAIIGMSCRFPGANNYVEYWDNLVEGKNSVVEIPKERWSWEDYFGDPASDVSKTNIKYGGFIDEIDKFDPLFFSISPTEANYIDPQHRIFLQAVWHAIEDSGYSPKSFAGREIGVYAGVSKNDYAELMRENQTQIISFLSTGTVHSILANRVSYLLDFKGKSEAVDTACSSFLVALNNAIRDIRGGFCEAAVVGGINAILSPTMYISHSKSGMLSEDGVCRTFDADANGYVRSEGVGVIFIKPLKQAVTDKDNILGVVKGSAVRHGGKSNYLTAPKVSSQAETISEAIKDACVDPKTIGYIEAHGTGTPLGDPIEINALKQAYQSFLNGTEKPYCGLSSVKTNIGHLESAAGIAGLIKILLSFKHNTIPALLHLNRVNPYIKLQDSPFYLVENNHDWKRITFNGKTYPLRAGVSSFGMGGVNAHVILEEPPIRRDKTSSNKRQKTSKHNVHFVPLSAKRPEQLSYYASALLKFLEVKEIGRTIENIAYTLQIGREAMEERVVFLADDHEHLLALLKLFIENKKNDHIVSGRVCPRDSVDSTEINGITTNPKKAAIRWVKGEDIDWGKSSDNLSGHRISLPGYPFHKLRCWYPIEENKRKTNFASENTGFFDQQTFSLSDYFIRDHVVQGESVVPGVWYLEIFRKIGEKLYQKPVRMIKDVFWMQAIKVKENTHATIDVGEKNTEDCKNLLLVKNNVVHCSGDVCVADEVKPTRKLDLEKIGNQCDLSIDKYALYARFKENGLEYGDSFRVIRNCHYNESSVLCEIAHDNEVHNRENELEPSMLDGVFQSVVALHILNLTLQADQQVPFYLKFIKIFKNIPKHGYVYAKKIRKASEPDRIAYKMYLCDSGGEIILEFDEFVKRVYVPKDFSKKERTNAVMPLYYKPQWTSRKLGMHCEKLSSIILFDTDDELQLELREKRVFKNIILVKKGKAFDKHSSSSYTLSPKDYEAFLLLWSKLAEEKINIDGVIYKWSFSHNSSSPKSLFDEAKLLLPLTQSLIYAKLPKKTRVIYLYPVDKSIASCVHASIGGFSRTLSYENPNIRIESVGVDDSRAGSLANIVLQELSFYQNAPLNEVQYLNKRREVRAITTYMHVTEIPERSLVKKRGTYLITGGSGGLGFIFAQHFAQYYGATLILLGRSEKNDIIEEKIRQLRSLGGDALYYTADVTNQASLLEVCKDLESNKVQLNGVLHCAGLIEDAYIVKKTNKSFDKVIGPKIAGSLNLDEVTSHMPLDFFVLFSSIAAIMPNQGQCDYATANSFLDAFSSYRNSLFDCGKRSGISVAFNWPLWKNGGIGVIKEEEEYLWEIFGMRPLETDRGIFILEHILNAGLDSSLHQLIAIDGSQDKIEKQLRVFESNNNVNELTSVSEAGIKNKLRSLVKKVVGKTDVIRDDENLTDIGVDSVGFTTLTSLINKSLSLEMEPTIFFDFQTIEQISNYIWDHYQEMLHGNRALATELSLYTPERALVDLDLSDHSMLHFQKSLSKEEFFMRDHVVEGLYNVPGACYVEMALEAGALIDKEERVYKLSNNYWAKQLSTPGDAILVDLNFIRKDSYYEYEISHLLKNERVIHAIGQVHTTTHDDERFDRHETLEINKIRNRCTIIRDPEEIYQFIHAEGLHVGPSFKPMLSVSLNSKEAISHLQLPDTLLDTFNDYMLHPSMLTGVLQTALLNNKPNGVDDTRYIPLAIDEIYVLRKIPAECYVYTELSGAGQLGDQIKKFNAKITTLQGVVTAEIRGLSLRNLNYSSNQSVKMVSQDKQNMNSITNSSALQLKQVEDLLKECLSESIGLLPNQIDSSVALESYGINSVMIVDLNRRLEQLFGNLSKTLFFEYKNIQELAEFFLNNYKAVIQEILIKNSSTQKATENSSKNIEFSYSSCESGAEDEDCFLVSTIDTRENQTFSPAQRSIDAVAIIGMSGRYPGARNLTEFWGNLENAKDCISEIPKSRFDLEALQYKFPDKNILPEKWGGFIEGVDEFDPLFFNISPREAEMIDPQERLFLEVVWETIENAGYDYNNLKNQPIGVFVGALWQPYISLGVEQTFQGNLQRPSGLLYSIPNRVSFYFDWSGPSIAIDTACSGSLTALHFACESLKRGESSSAVVGGVNLSFASSKYLWLSHNNFLSSDGKCRSFGEGGDGYVPGEGVGAVYLKPMSDAIRDGDRIDGIIKGTSVNHGGKTNGYTVPNPNRQSELILSTLKKSGILPEDVSYIEAHGTGTSLGDPIEITGLQNAFIKFTDKRQFCAIGSVKSNIGHLEAAAGIAGLTKLLLQMKYGTLVPSINSEELNPNVDFSLTPFVVQRKCTPWLRNKISGKIKSDTEVPYRAMISSFGAGGSNAHAIIEEYQNAKSFIENETIRLSCGDKLIIPLSAKSAERLKVHAANLCDYLFDNRSNKNIGWNDNRYNEKVLDDVAYTLQVGRDAMDERIVFLVKDVVELREKLNKYISGDNVNIPGVYQGNVNASKETFQLLTSDKNILSVFREWVSSGNGEKIAKLWTQGVEIEWKLLYPGRTPKKIGLPTYPFKRDKYWIKARDESTTYYKNKRKNTELEVLSKIDWIHPLLHENTSNLYAQRYSTSFTGDEAYFTDESETGECVLLNMACLEMAKMAIEHASVNMNRSLDKIRLYDVSWSNTVAIKDSKINLHIELKIDDEHGNESENIYFEIYSGSTHRGEKKDIHAHGNAKIVDASNAEKVNISSLKNVMSTSDLGSNGSYELMMSTVETRVESIVMIQGINADKSGVLVEFKLQAPLEKTTKEFLCHSGGLNFILSTISSLANQQPKYDENIACLNVLSQTKLYQPITTKNVEVIKDFSEKMHLWVRNVECSTLVTNQVDEKKYVKIDIDIIDNVGDICVSMTELLFNTEIESNNGIGLSSTKSVNRKYPESLEKPAEITLLDLCQSNETKPIQPALQLSKKQLQVNKLYEIEDSTARTYQNIDNIILKKGINVISKPDLVQGLTESLVNVLYLQQDNVDINKQFTDLGLDSIIGVEWVKAINSKYSLNINAAKVYDYPNIRQFSDYLFDTLNKNMHENNTNLPAKTPVKLTGSIKSDKSDITKTFKNKNDNVTKIRERDIEDNMLQEELVKSLSKALYMNESDINVNALFTDLGLDSIVGVEWIQLINATFGTSIPATTVYDYPSIEEFSRYIKKVLEESKLAMVD